MAHTHTDIGTQTGFSIRAMVADVLANMSKARARRAAYNRTLSELNRMTDRDLADIGLVRGMIPEIAQQEMEKH